MESEDFKFLGGKVPVSGISVNVDVHLIQITEDKLRNILVEHHGNATAEKNWVAPLSLFLSFILVLTTTDAKEIFGVSANMWETIFIFACGVSVFWLVIAVKNRRAAMGVEQVIQRIKNT